MFVSDRTMKLLLESGIAPDKLVQIVQALRDDEAASRPVRTANAERQAKHRAAKKALLSVTEITPVTDSNACVTESNGNNAEPSRTQVVTPSLPSLRSEELKNPPVKPNGLTAPKGAPRRGSKSAPDDWTPSAETMRVLAAEGHDSGSIERALTMMRDHEFRTARTKWDATFRNWVREDAKRQPRKANDRPHHDNRQTAREDRLGRMLRGAMAAVDERKSELG